MATTTRKTEPTLQEALAVLEKAQQDPESAEAALLTEWLRAQAPATSSDEAADVYTAIWAVMREVQFVGKHGRNSDQNYPFRGIDDVMNALGPAMRKHGLLIFPKIMRLDHEKYVRQQQGNGIQKFSHAVKVQIRYRFHFAKGGKDDYVDVEVPGESIDTSDKATAKAMSVALRTAMLQTFALPTYEPDPDQHNPEIETVAPIPVEELKAAVRRANTYEDLDQGFADLRAHYGSRIAASKAPNADGEELDGDAYLAYAYNVAVEWRAERAREQQDDAAQEGPAQEEAPAQDARAEEPTEPAQETREQEQAARAASAPTSETSDEKFRRVAREENQWQSEILGVNPKEHAAPMLDKDGKLIRAKALQYIPAQRAVVIARLREVGASTMADAYARIGDGFPIELSKWVNADDNDRQPAGAAQ